jgi:thiol-disulfide isomerase/thioredoxin
MPHRPDLTAQEPLLVACLCATWCTTCEAYRALFEAQALAHPGVRFAWIDIEDHSDALEAADGGAPDIQNFPTLLLMQDGKVRFFGTVLPHAAVLERLLREAQQGSLPVLTDPQTLSLGRAVDHLIASGAPGTHD